MKRITKIKWLKVSLIISIVMVCLYAIAQDEPSGYTSWFRLRMWEEGDHPGADSVNQNLIDIDLHLHNRDKRIDSLKSAYMEMFNFPSGTWKRYDSTVFDGDSLKFKTGIIPKLASNNTWTGTNNFSSTQTDFGDGTVIFDLNLTPGEGVFQIRDNSDPLLIYDDDTQTWDFQYPVSINGVPITSGGGDAYLTNRQTFTKRNVFSDTLKADGLSLIDNARITSNLNVTGDVISDLNFLKGSLTRIGTISTDSLAIITDNINRMIVSKYGKVMFNDSVLFNDHALFMDSLVVTGAIAILDSMKILKTAEIGQTLYVGGDIISLSDVTANNFWGNGSQITDLNAGYLSSGTILRSRLSDSVFKLGNLDTTRFLDQSDTSKYFRVGDVFTPINEVVNSIVTFATTVTFTLSPVFSALVNFANGISTTTLTASSTATFNGDLVNTGWRTQGAMLNRNKYYKDTVLYMVTTASPPYTGTNFTVAHGIANWKSIVSYDFLIHDDSLNIVVRPNLYPNTTNLAPYLFNYASVDSTVARINVPGAAVNLFNDTCTVYIRYTDYNR